MPKDVSFLEISNLFLSLNVDERRFIINNGVLLKSMIGNILSEEKKYTFATPLTDEEAVTFLHRNACCEPSSTVSAWRSYSRSVDYNGPCCWHLRKGFSLFENGSKTGPFCGGRVLLNKEALHQCKELSLPAIAFWIPVVAKSSTSRSFAEQNDYLRILRELNGLPEVHCLSLGSISVIVPLVFSHFRETGCRAPDSLLSVSTDDKYSRGRVVTITFEKSGLRCNVWDGNRDDNVGFFLLGLNPIDS
ncbi:MAG: hypothetical protein WC457_02190 [Patescibacteria group bacterium]